jgi:hypothetical protein
LTYTLMPVTTNSVLSLSNEGIPIAYYSHKLTEAQKKYTTLEK